LKDFLYGNEPTRRIYIFFWIGIFALAFSIFFAMRDEAFVKRDIYGVVTGKSTHVCGKDHHQCASIYYLGDNGVKFTLDASMESFNSTQVGNITALHLNRHEMRMVHGLEAWIELINAGIFIFGFVVSFFTIPEVGHWIYLKKFRSGKREIIK
jgi:hypothetical protein